MAIEVGDDTLSDEELDELFGDEQQETPPAQEAQDKDLGDKAEQTKAFANRLQKRTTEAVTAEQERIAKEMGFNTYDEMMKSRQNKAIEDKGLDPEVVSPIIDELVNDRLAKDPRMAELDALRQERVNAFADKELKELSKLTGIEYTSLDKIPKDVIEDWKTSGSLVKSYMSLHGADLLRATRKAAAAGTTDHLASPKGTSAPTPSNMRHLTDQERSVYKQMIRGITDKELDEKLVEK